LRRTALKVAWPMAPMLAPQVALPVSAPLLAAQVE
jgi:hypothetical protein